MFYHYPGALHMHTTYSDGSGTVADLAAAAARAGLRWIIITDHDDIRARAEQGWYADVAVMAGYEITPDRNHYLVAGVDELVSKEMSPAEYVHTVADIGGLGIVAHPDEEVTHELTEPYRWEDWSIRGFDGIELWNYMSEWIEKYTRRRRYLNFFFPQLIVRGPTDNTLKWWDQLAVEGECTTGVFGVDAHATRVDSFGRTWEVYPYERLFNTLTDYVVLDEPLDADFDTAAQQILDAVRRGRVLMANRTWGDAGEMAFLARLDDETTLTAGDRAHFNGHAIIDFLAPKPAHIRLYRDGTSIASANGVRSLTFDAHEPGHYRIEVRRWGQLWLMTNHIHLLA